MKKQFMTYVAAFAAASLTGGVMAQNQAANQQNQQRDSQQQMQGQRSQQMQGQKARQMQGQDGQMSQQDRQQAQLIFVLANEPQQHFVTALQRFSAGQKGEAAQELTLAADEISGIAQTTEKHGGDFFEQGALKQDAQKLKSFAEKLRNDEDVSVDEMNKLFAKTNLDLSKYFVVEAESALKGDKGLIAGHNLQSASTTFRQALVWSQQQPDQEAIQTIAMANAYADLLHRGLPQQMGGEAQTAAGRVGGHFDQQNQRDVNGDARTVGGRQAGDREAQGQRDSSQRDSSQRDSSQRNANERDSDRGGVERNDAEIGNVVPRDDEQPARRANQADAEGEIGNVVPRDGGDNNARTGTNRAANPDPDSSVEGTDGVVGNDPAASQGRATTPIPDPDPDSSVEGTDGVVGNDPAASQFMMEQSRKANIPNPDPDSSVEGTDGVVGNDPAASQYMRDQARQANRGTADQRDAASGESSDMAQRQQAAQRDLKLRQERLFEDEGPNATVDKEVIRQRDVESPNQGTARMGQQGQREQQAQLGQRDQRDTQRTQGQLGQQGQRDTQLGQQGQQLSEREVVQNAQKVIDSLKQQITQLEGKIGELDQQG